MFSFICGILGHSENFFNKLFEVPEGEIAKPYGPWMRAPFKSHVKPIGSQWLRTEFGNEGPSSEMKNSKDDDNQDPEITPKNMQVVKHEGNVGITNNKNKSPGAGKVLGNISTAVPLISVQLNDKDTKMIESKKRRTDDGLGYDSNMGLNRDVLMGSEEEFMTEEQHENVVETDNSKNGYVASTHGGARLAL